jgi:uncharacterized membrane protein (UPF0127 family)
MTKPHASLTGLREIPVLTLVLAMACSPQPRVISTAPNPPGTPPVAGRPVPETEMGVQDRTGGGAAAPAAGKAWVVFGNDTVTAEVASTPDQRSQGLMDRAQIPDGTGMLFVFQDEEVRSFWMRNTLVSLDIAFMDSALRIVDIQQMEARSEDFHDSRYPARYALEVPQGWFAAHGVRIGDTPKLVMGR